MPRRFAVLAVAALAMPIASCASSTRGSDDAAAPGQDARVQDGSSQDAGQDAGPPPGGEPTVIAVGDAAVVDDDGGTTRRPPPMCFGAGTPIATPDGERAIEALEVGDLVWAYAHTTHRRVARRVIAVHHHPPTTVGRLVLGAGRALLVTDEHPVFDAASGRYLPAAEFGERHALLRLGQGGTVVPVAGPTFEAAVDELAVHNLSVEDTENYFAAGVLVHNKPPIQ